jgi:hypothetical protein
MEHVRKATALLRGERILPSGRTHTQIKRILADSGAWNIACSMRGHENSRCHAVVILSLCAMPFDAAAESVCMKPWAIADKWIDNHDETEPMDQIWTPDDTFDTVDADGNPLLDADVYIPTVTGFSIADIGRRVWLKIDDPGTATKESSFAVDLNGAGGGGDAYRTAITTCDPTAPHFRELR